MGIIQNILSSRTVKNAVQSQDGFNGYNSSQLNNYNGYVTDVYTRDYMSFFDGIAGAGKYDNFYADANRIVQVASQHQLYYTTKSGKVQTKGAIAQYLDKPNEDYPQKKVLEQMYTELITQGCTDIFLWRKDGRTESRYFDDKQYKEDDFRGWTLVSGYNRFNKLDKQNIVRITNGASQQNVFMGYSPTQAAQSWRKMQDEMGLHMTAFAKNAGMPLGQWIITAQTPEEYASIREKLDKKVSGAKNNGKQLYSYLPSSAKQPQIHWQEFSAKEVQDYTSQLEFSEKKMSQSFGVPGTIKGTNDDASYATARVSEQVFIKYTIKPLIESLKEQLTFEIEKRFNVAGEIRVDIDIPEVADESLVKIQATAQQVELFDKKRAEGYTAESIVKAYNLPESFLLLELEPVTTESTETPQNASKQATEHVHNDLHRAYMNAMTDKEREDVEKNYRKITKSYSDDIIENGLTEDLREEYIGKMEVEFGEQYSKFYTKNLDDIAAELVAALEAVDISSLELTPEELQLAREQYRKRVDDFSKSFADQIEKLPGETLKAKKLAADDKIERVVVNETEHSRIVSELNGWTKAESEFPVRVTKTWKAIIDSRTCQECIDMNGTSIDVTQLFINNPNVKEVYEVMGGMLHVSCRCLVTYEMEAESVRDYDSN